ncbi:Mtc3p KNAG_0B00430 [Huiozyma naganishii CBS 8797]|uniref:Uncharacterized protein n=1 Tax=Huiozyma naganishii (strain ATCC MYA-139 / BCRC 22969 / CBS 8797 / KCTC 17520 / NBRC 10181 / NCYC 3082 / Yp74L-3) TaxID=1071383 RepID=J7RUK0_HUIN7|nr:hypothetical protein KNAG_0B00430 [Kazachstania naganishii CBS 8797]CCK68492.1 hypothetical protein KNAG_0B00430 [Kazachstania naganishii CBS 8797]
MQQPLTRMLGFRRPFSYKSTCLQREVHQTRCDNTTSTTEYTPPDAINRAPEEWDRLLPAVQEEIKEYIDWTMTGDWRDMPARDTRYAYYLSYGSWGPRSPHGTARTASGAYIASRMLFNATLFAAVCVSLINWRRDRRHLVEESTV